MLPALTPNSWRQKTQPAVSRSPRSTTIPSRLAPPAPAAATIKTTAFSKKLILKLSKIKKKFLSKLTDEINLCRANSKTLSLPGINTPRKDNQPLLQCTRHMCPIRIHWHLKLNYEKYWRAKIAITNFNYRLNYTQWTLVVQHPNLSNLTQVFSFDYKPIVPYQSISKSKTVASQLSHGI
ncbi:hypothetical protein QQ045_023986 [Rhodiola kirilowii]